jgi:hypothetical protein
VEKCVGIVLNNFREVVAGVSKMLDPATLAEFKKNVAAQNNRAVFDIPEILAELLDEPPLAVSNQTAKQTNSTQTPVKTPV